MVRVEAWAVSDDRARVYRALSRLFRPWDEASLAELRAREVPELRRALARLGAGPPILQSARELAARIAASDLGHLRQSYRECFEPGGGMRCPPTETSHTEEGPPGGRERALEMGDLVAFYRAFGIDAAAAASRPDHVAAELEFMHLLAVREAVAAGDADGEEHAAVCRDAARAFLRDHLGRWTHRFAERLEEIHADPTLVAAGHLLDDFVAFDAAWLGAR